MRFNIRRTVRVAALALPVALASLAATSPHAWADEDVALGMGKKFARGVVNAGTGWLELPKEWVEQSKAHPTYGWAAGTLTGLGMILQRSAAGIAETAFFFVPAPEHYAPVMDPNTVFGDVPALR